VPKVGVVDDFDRGGVACPPIFSTGSPVRGKLMRR
jgi:hypothetical protein